jgi:hypothetical protein
VSRVLGGPTGWLSRPWRRFKDCHRECPRARTLLPATALLKVRWWMPRRTSRSRRPRLPSAVRAQTPPTAFTDASGRFVFRELPAGGFWVNASKSGYNQAQDSLGADSNLQITLGADETKKGVEIALVPGGSIRGRVLNEDGLAVRNCYVTGRATRIRARQTHPDGRGRWHGTDDKGEYRIFRAGSRTLLFFRALPCRTARPRTRCCRAEIPARLTKLTCRSFMAAASIPPLPPGWRWPRAQVWRESISRCAAHEAFALRGSITTSDPEGLARQRKRYALSRRTLCCRI